MKLLPLFTGAAVFVLALASGIFAATLYTLTVAFSFVLIVAHDYRARPRSYAVGRSDPTPARERLLLAV